MNDLVLYGSALSGHSYKVALALALLGLGFEYRAVDLGVPRQDRRADFKLASRFNEVPVLIDGAQPPLVQSNAILLHLCRKTNRLLGEEGWTALEQWLFWESNRIGFSASNLRFARRFTPDAAPELIEWLRVRAVADLTALEKSLNGRRFITGSSASMADVSCCGYMFWLEEADLDLAHWPKLHEWLARIRALPGWGPPEMLLRTRR